MADKPKEQYGNAKKSAVYQLMSAVESMPEKEEAKPDRVRSGRGKFREKDCGSSGTYGR